MRANTVRPLALIAASSRLMVASGGWLLLMVVKPGTAMLASDRVVRPEMIAQRQRAFLTTRGGTVRDRHVFLAHANYIAGMPTLVAGAVAVIVLYLLLQMFRAANPAVLARAVKIVGGVLALAVAAFTGIRGELAVAVPLGIFGAGLLGWAPFGTPGFGQIAGLFGGGGGQRSNGQASRVRSPFFEMTLDHDTNGLIGTVV